MALRRIAIARKSSSQIISEKNMALRQEFWPDITENMLWHRKRKIGFTTVPRTMSYIFEIMDSLSPGKPVSRAYFVLWCHTFDEYMVTIANPRAMALESGFRGERAESTWNGRMKILCDLGFIKAKSGASGLYNYVLIMNPYTIIRELKEGRKTIPLDTYNAFFERTTQIGATDMD
jgi:hypothetical protein